jgi:hypothetical protein
MSEVLKDTERKRTMLCCIPNRIEFRFSFLRFYIDFTVVDSENADPSDLKGGIIYGASRTICFSECQLPKDKCETCQRTVRCDNLEDKPLLYFTVNQHGMIQSSGEFEEDWWAEDKSNLLDLHYRTMDLIWKDALHWANEILMP